MRVRLGTLRQYIALMINEEAWVPGRYYPGSEPLDDDDAERLNTPLGEVDTDPSNNPGRPADAAEYIGMKPNPSWAMAHPASAGGGGDSLADLGDEASGGEESSPDEV